MLNRDLIVDKLLAMKKYLSELMPILDKVNKSTEPSNESVHAVERLLQLIVDAAIDINTHIITRNNMETPNDYQGTFAILARGDVMPTDFATRIANSVGLRNLLVHGYEKVERAKMLRDVTQNIGQYYEYVKYIYDFLDKQEKQG